MVFLKLPQYLLVFNLPFSTFFLELWSEINRSIHCLFDLFNHWSMGWFMWNRLYFFMLFFLQRCWNTVKRGIRGNQWRTNWHSSGTYHPSSALIRPKIPEFKVLYHVDGEQLFFLRGKSVRKNAKLVIVQAWLWGCRTNGFAYHARTRMIVHLCCVLLCVLLHGFRAKGRLLAMYMLQVKIKFRSKLF